MKYYSLVLCVIFLSACDNSTKSTTTKIKVTPVKKYKPIEESLLKQIKQRHNTVINKVKNSKVLDYIKNKYPGYYYFAACKTNLIGDDKQEVAIGLVSPEKRGMRYIVVMKDKKHALYDIVIERDQGDIFIERNNIKSQILQDTAKSTLDISSSYPINIKYAGSKSTAVETTCLQKDEVKSHIGKPRIINYGAACIHSIGMIGIYDCYQYDPKTKEMEQFTDFAY